MADNPTALTPDSFMDAKRAVAPPSPRGLTPDSFMAARPPKASDSLPQPEQAVEEATDMARAIAERATRPPGLPPGVGAPPGAPRLPLPWESDLQFNNPPDNGDIPQKLLNTVFEGAGRLASGVEQMSEPGMRAKAGGLHKTISGAFDVASPTMMGAGAAAPLRTALTVGAGIAAQKGTVLGLRYLGLPTEYADVAGDLVGLIAGAVSHGKLSRAEIKNEVAPILQQRAATKESHVPQQSETQPPAAAAPVSGQRQPARQAQPGERPAAGASHPAASGPAPAAPVTTDTLPATLRGAKPKYNFGDRAFDLDFESDFDKAAYITAQHSRSKADAGYLNFAMQASGMAEPEVRAHGMRVRAEIKESARSAAPGRLKVRRVQHMHERLEAQAEAAHGDDSNQRAADVVRPDGGGAPAGAQPPVPQGDGPGPVRGLPGAGAGGPDGGQSAAAAAGEGQNLRRVTGSADLPLTADGKEQARQLEVPAEAQVFHAPNDRSAETARTSSGKAQAADWLEPWRLGEHEGKPLPAAQSIINHLMANPHESPGVSPHSGEQGEPYRVARDRLVMGAAKQRAGMQGAEKILNITSGRAIAIIGGNPAQEIQAGTIYRRMSSGEMMPVRSMDVPGQYFTPHAETAWNPAESGGSPGEPAAGIARDNAQSVAEKPQSATNLQPNAATSPAERGPGWVGNIPTSDIRVDAPRFQFKRNVGQGGAGEEFRQVTHWDPELAGVVHVWRDPADGRTYVVNGHHRVELAQRIGVGEMTVRYLDAPTAQEARLKGALINIAEGHGESVDAAKVFRDSGMTPADLEGRGISLKGKVASEGMALARLAPPIFDDVVAGDLTPARGAVIGAGVERPADQVALYDLVRKMERGGKRLTNDQLEELIRMNGRTPTVTENTADQAQGSMFGEEEMTRSLLPEKAIVSDYVRQQLKAEKKLFGAVSTQAAAERLAEGGNVIQAGTNAAKAEGANQGMVLYDKLSGSAGPIDGMLDRAAQRLANGENANEAKQQAYREIRDHLTAQIRQLGGEDGGRAGRVAPAGDREAGAGQYDQAQEVAAARARLKARLGELAAGEEGAQHGKLDPRDLEDFVLVASDYVRRAGEGFDHFAKAMMEQFGRAIVPHLETVYKAALTRLQRQTSLVSAEDELASRTAEETRQARLLGEQLTAQMKSGGAVKPPKVKPAETRGLFEPEGPEQGSLLGRFWGEETGTSLVGHIFRADVDAVRELKARRDEALGKLEAAKASPEEKQFGQRLVEYYTGERDLWVTRVNQVLDRLRTMIPGVVERQGLAIYRDFKTRPGELDQWLKGTHLNLRMLEAPEYKLAMERIEKLRPAILQAMHPTARMLEADQALTRIAEASARVGQQLGFLDRSLNPERYFTHLLYPKNADVTPVPLSERMGKALGGKIGREYAYNARREYPTILDAIADNAKPKTLDVFTAFSIHGDKFATARATNLLINALHEPGVGGHANGAAIWGTPGAKNIPADWVEIAPHARLFRNEVRYEDEQGQPQIAQQTLFVPKVIEHALRPITDPDYMSRLPGFSHLRHSQAYLKAVQLGLSFFHVTTENYMALSNMGPKGWIRGLRADRQSAEFLKLEREFIAHGGTTSILGRTVEAYKSLEPGLIPTWGDIWKRAPVIHQVDQLAGKITDFTFDKIQRQFKVTDYSMHKAAWMADHPQASQMETRAALASMAKEINAVYGGLNWENVGVNHMSVEVARAIMLAPDWTISNVFNIKYSLERGTQAGKLARMFWARQLVGGMVLTQLMSLALSQKLSKNPTQVYMGTDKNGEDIYQNVFFKGAGGDAVNLVHNIADYGAVQGLVRTMAGKAAPVLRTGLELANNTNYLGRTLIPRGMNPLASTVRGAWEAAKGVAPTPLTLSNWKDMLIGPDAGKYSVPEFFTVPFVGTPPRHVPPGGMRMRNGELEEYTPPENQSIWDEIRNGKR